MPLYAAIDSMARTASINLEGGERCVHFKETSAVHDSQRHYFSGAFLYDLSGSA
jgi:hypothetical protein